MGFDDYFDRHAGRFSRLYNSQAVTRALGRGALFDRLAFAVEVAEKEGAGHVLDIGCGSGVLFGPLAERDIRVTGLDPAPAMVDIARKEAARFPGLVQVEQREWQSVGGDDKADLAVALGVFDYVDEPVELLRRMSAVAPSCVGSFPSKGPRTALRNFRYGLQGVKVHGYSRGDLTAMATEVGTEIVELRPLGRAGYVVHFRQKP